MRNKSIINIGICTLIFLFNMCSIQAESSEYTVTSIEEITEAGTYDVILHDESNTHRKTIKVTVLFPRTVERREISEAIDAHDIQIETGEFSMLTNNQLIALANARAWNTNNNAIIPIIRVARHIESSSQGQFQVSFATEAGTTTTIQVLESEKKIPKSLEKTSSYFNISTYKTESLYFIFALVFFITPIILLGILFFVTYKNKKDYENLLFKK